MSAFSPEWLKLREPADQRSRNKDVANAVSAWFMQRASLGVVDLGSGTGANLRALAPLLPNRQSWTLIDNDRDLAAAGLGELKDWADSARAEGADLVLTKGQAEISVRYRHYDLSGDIDNALEGAELVTTSAFLDLASQDFIKRLARAAAGRRAAFYGVLTYNGLQKWAPHRPSDNEMAAAFNRHQMTDKGLGVAAGPLAPAVAADQFRLEGYTVIEGESPWRLGANDRMLLAELQRGHALAVLELKTVEARTVESWVKVIRSGVEIGHTDIFAVPS